jgi:site-specific DNA recombinase
MDRVRTLGATRLSRVKDESTSIERQREQITLTAKVRGDELIHMTEDTDISGSVSPFERDGLGPWLTEPAKIAQWDVLIVAKLDRLTRSLRDFDEIVSWLDRHGKTLVSVSESLDLSTSTGRMFANLLAMFAQFERERIGERRREAGVHMRQNGWWQGGQPPYGRRPVQVNGHWVLEVDPGQQAVIERMAREVIEGKARRAVARMLTAEGVPTPNGAEAWSERTITKILMSEDAVLDPVTRAQVLEALNKTTTPWTKRGDAAMLLNIAYCVCGQPMYAQRWKHKASGKVYEYYGCALKCGNRRIPMTELESAVDTLMSDPDGPYGKVPVYTETIKPGRSLRAEITLLERKMDALDKDAADHLERYMEMARERKRLTEASASADERQELDTGLTVSQYWATLDTRDKRRQFLLEARMRLFSVTRNTGQMRGPILERFVIRSKAA